jgi:mRNA interferase MazF
MGYEKDYDRWNNKKKDLNKRVLPDSFFFLEREIWWTSTGTNIGREIDGKHENFERPVLILKKFSEYDFIGLPISTKKNIYEILHKMIYHNEPRYVLLKQTRYYSSKRLLRLIMRMEESEFLIVRDKVMNLFI